MILFQDSQSDHFEKYMTWKRNQGRKKLKRNVLIGTGIVGTGAAILGRKKIGSSVSNLFNRIRRIKTTRTPKAANSSVSGPIAVPKIEPIEDEVTQLLRKGKIKEKRGYLENAFKKTKDASIGREVGKNKYKHPAEIANEKLRKEMLNIESELNVQKDINKMHRAESIREKRIVAGKIDYPMTVIGGKKKDLRRINADLEKSISGSPTQEKLLKRRASLESEIEDNKKLLVKNMYDIAGRERPVKKEVKRIVKQDVPESRAETIKNKRRPTKRSIVNRHKLMNMPNPGEHE